MTRVALDLLGGDGAPEAVVDGALQAAQRYEALSRLPLDFVGNVLAKGLEGSSTREGLVPRIAGDLRELRAGAA